MPTKALFAFLPITGFAVERRGAALESMTRPMGRIRGVRVNRIVADVDERQTLRPPCGDERGNVRFGLEIVARPPARVVDRLLHVDDDENRVRRQPHGRHGRRGASAQ